MQKTDTPKPDVYQRFLDRGWFDEDWRSGLSDVFAHAAKQRAHADRQREVARSMRAEARAMQARTPLP
jgi:hypothetical protein